MRLNKKSILGALLLTASIAQADTTWNDSKIEKLGNQALQSINQFVKGDEKSELYQNLSESKQKKIRKIVDPNSVYSFVEIVNAIDHEMPSSDRTPYSALRASLTYSNANTLDLYDSLLMNYDDSALYVFEKLKTLNLTNAKNIKKRENLHRNYGFSGDGQSINSDQEYAEVCLKFSLPVRGEPAQDWESHFNITPKPRGKLYYRGNKICFNGEWQTRYQVKVDQMLQGKNRLTLRKAIDERINTGTRTPMMRFASSGFVLDANSERHLALSTANIDNVDVELWQLSASNLASDRIQSLISAPQDVSSWKLDNILSRNGEKRFEGTFNVGEYKTNQTTTTNIFFDDLKTDKPTKSGIYVLKAHNNTLGKYTKIAFSLSNAGFSAYLTDAGLWAELRDLKTTKPIKGQKVRLHAVDNSVLATATTDRDGVAHFNKPTLMGENGLRPSHIVSENDNYFAFLEIEGNPVDLSDKGLSGAIENAPLRSWVWKDRGVYRPNDTAHIMWLLKTSDGKPFHSTPIWLGLYRPDGKVMLERMVSAGVSGAYRFDHFFNNVAPQGDWRIRLSLGKKGALLAEKTIPVSSIAPQQIEAEFTPLEQEIQANQSVKIGVQADWLYGSPASELGATLSQKAIERDLASESKILGENWQIGLHDEKISTKKISYSRKDTDNNGTVSFTANTSNIPVSTKPLQLELTANVYEPSGQIVKVKKNKAISRKNPYLALQGVDSNTPKVALINDNGYLQAGEATWKLYRLNYDYYWYKSGSKWNYQHNENRRLVKEGKVSLNATAPSVINDLPLDDGAWVLVVHGKDATIASSIPLEFGTYSAPRKGTAPDRITMSSKSERYKSNDKVTVHLNAPFDGHASIKFAHNDSIIDNRSVEFKDGKATLIFDWKSDWDDGLWLLSNAWNKDQKSPHNRRAVGLQWLGGDLSNYKLDIKMSAPDNIKPLETLNVTLSIPKSQATSETWAQVAIIDEGLYRLTKPNFQSPLKKFWAKKQLNAQFFDVWGNIIRQVEGRKANLRSGAGDDESADLSALKNLPERDVQLVTYWSKPIKFINGKANVSMPVPQFNGRLRIMAAGWNAQRLSGIEKTVQVRAPLVGTLYTPPFLTKGDAGNIRLRLHNTTDVPMAITAKITAKGLSFKAKDGVKKRVEDSNKPNNTIEKTFNVAAGQEQWFTQPFKTVDGESVRAKFDVIVNGDSSVSNANTINIHRFADIRQLALPRRSQKMTLLNIDDKISITPAAKSTLFERKIIVSNRSPFDAKTLVDGISVYPYGCVEQTTTAAWNNLYIPLLRQSKAEWGKADDFEKRLFKSHSKLANYQDSYGGFSLWGTGGQDTWLTAYVTEFLLESQASAKLGNPAMLKRALKYLRQQVMTDSENNASLAYAHYVLAKAGEPVQGATLRYAESLLLDGKTALSPQNLHIISALVAHGEMELASRLMTAMQMQDYNPKFFNNNRHYGTQLRNLSQSLTVLYQLNAQLEKQKASKVIKTLTKDTITVLWAPLHEATALAKNAYSTQEAHWLTALSVAMPVEQVVSHVTINGKPTKIRGEYTIKQTVNDTNAVDIINHSGTAIYVLETQWSQPPEQEVLENGFRVSMQYEDKAGNPVNLNNLKQNQQFLAIATITEANGVNNSDVMFAYPIPAGLALQTLDTDLTQNTKRTWAKKLKRANFSENRDDRNLAAFTVSKNETFTHAFLLRATNKGVWNATGYGVENMYQPNVFSIYPGVLIKVD